MLLRAIYEWFVIGSSENIRFSDIFRTWYEDKTRKSPYLTWLPDRPCCLAFVAHQEIIELRLLHYSFPKKKKAEKQTPGIGIYQSQPKEFIVCIFERCTNMMTTAYDVIRCRQCRTREEARRQQVKKCRIDANAARKQARVGFIHAQASLGSACKLSILQ